MKYEEGFNDEKYVAGVAKERYIFAWFKAMADKDAFVEWLKTIYWNEPLDDEQIQSILDMAEFGSKLEFDNQLEYFKKYGKDWIKLIGEDGRVHEE